MKSILCVLLSCTFLFAFAQDEVICHTLSTEKFGLFASNKIFNSNHLEPLPYVHISQSGGETVKLKCADGIEVNAYWLKSNSNNWIFVFQEWWGLNDHSLEF